MQGHNHFLMSKKIQPGQIFWANFKNSVGGEIQDKKDRPYLILAVEPKWVVVAPLSSQIQHARPHEPIIQRGEGNLAYDSRVVVSQIRACDPSRLKDYRGTIHPETLARIRSCVAAYYLTLSFSLAPLNTEQKQQPQLFLKQLTSPNSQIRTTIKQDRMFLTDPHGKTKQVIKNTLTVTTYQS